MDIPSSKTPSSANSEAAKDISSPHPKVGLSRKPSIGRVVRSRYREAAAARKLTDNSSSNNNSSSHNSIGGSSKKTSANDSTGSATKGRPRQQQQQQLLSSAESSLGRKLTAAASSSARLRGARSKLFANTSASNARNGAGAANNARQSVAGGIVSKRSSMPTTKCAPAARSRVANKLHSTAVNATLLNTTECPGSTAQLSSTVVSQRGRSSSSSFPELPDISAIKIVDSSTRGDSISPHLELPVSTIGGGSVCNLRDGPCETIAEDEQESRDVSQEELDVMYLNYLTWAHMNASSAAAHAAAVEPLQREVCFLEELVSSKEEEAADLRQKLFLMDSLKNAQQLHDTLLPLLRDINDGGSSWCDNLQGLAHQLENHLHQVTLAPAVLPDTAEEITGELSKITDIINGLLERAPSRTTELLSATSVLEDTRKLQRCYRDVQETACLILERCSLELTPATN